jgi:hypothetical protein
MPAGEDWSTGVMEYWSNAFKNPILHHSLLRHSNFPPALLARIREFAIARNASLRRALFFCCFRLASGLLLAVLGMSLR